jgi:hypothetical protein
MHVKRAIYGCVLVPLVLGVVDLVVRVRVRKVELSYSLRLNHAIGIDTYQVGL